jgi:hypothetical protein
MKTTQTKTVRSSFSPVVRVTGALLALVLLAAVSYGKGKHKGKDKGHKEHPPSVPAALQVPAGNELQLHVSAVGVQIYVWTINPTNAALSSWVLKAPHAVLFGTEKDEKGDVLGIHFSGPTWEANDGSKVVGTRIASSNVNAHAIPWLLLSGTSAGDGGIFAETTYIQRVDTVGGLAPTTPGIVGGEEVLVPYIADYYFYQAD